MFCHGCGQDSHHKVFRQFGMFCSKACEDIFAAEVLEVEAELLQNGFVQDKETPNIYRKDGVAVTKEQLHRANLPAILSLHKAVVSSRA